MSSLTRPVPLSSNMLKHEPLRFQIWRVTVKLLITFTQNSSLVSTSKKGIFFFITLHESFPYMTKERKNKQIREEIAPKNVVLHTLHPCMTFICQWVPLELIPHRVVFSVFLYDPSTSVWWLFKDDLDSDWFQVADQLRQQWLENTFRYLVKLKLRKVLSLFETGFRDFHFFLMKYHNNKRSCGGGCYIYGWYQRCFLWADKTLHHWCNIF